MKRKIVAGNWKMNLLREEACALAAAVARGAGELGGVEVWVAPPALWIPEVSAVLKGSPILCGGQNVHWESSGAYTGELSPAMLRSAGCAFALVGHSERRNIFMESPELVAKRFHGALKSGLIPVLCVGEKLDERESGKTAEVVRAQLLPCLADLPAEHRAKFIIAYEPVWAIGTGKVASTAQIAETHGEIVRMCKKWECPAPILYGGSVTPENFAEIIAVPSVNGALVGGASLVAEKFLKLVELAKANAD